MSRSPPPRTRSQLVEQAKALLALHRAGQPLVLPNAWDASSARAVEKAGFPVVATTSAGVARSLGFEDHQAAPVEEMLAAAARIARAVSLPVTVDFEADYGLASATVIERLLEAGPPAATSRTPTTLPADSFLQPRRPSASPLFARPPRARACRSC